MEPFLTRNPEKNAAAMADKTGDRATQDPQSADSVGPFAEQVSDCQTCRPTAALHLKFVHPSEAYDIIQPISEAPTCEVSQGTRMNEIAPNRPTMKITAKDRQRRSEIVRQAEANNRIEGISSGPESKAVFESYVNGEIEVTDLVPRLKILYKVP
jgi:hypothetical protein